MNRIFTFLGMVLFWTGGWVAAADLSSNAEILLVTDEAADASGDVSSAAPVPETDSETDSVAASDRESGSVDETDGFGQEPNFRDFVTRKEFEEEVSKLAWKKGPFTFTPYGFLWVNGSWNSSRCVTDAFCLYSLSDDADDTAGASVDARTSRIGAMIDGPGFPGNSAIKLKGVFEADFQGQTNVTRNKGQVQLRKAFVELYNPETETKFEFGQDWDTISPLAPQMLNYLPAGFAGNIGYRRCQMRMEKRFTHSADCKTIWTIGLADPFPGDYISTNCVNAEAGSWPMIQGRAAVRLGDSSRCGLPITLGVSGHIGEETYKFTPVAGTLADTSETKHIKTWSFNFDGDFPITKRVLLQGEYFLGKDLSTFCGGVNQGVDLYRRDGVRAQGGWMSLHTLLTDKLTNNTGYAVDKPFKDDLAGTCVAVNGMSNIRTQNSVIFTNLLYQWNKALMTGVEFGYWKTGYEKTDVSTEDIRYEDMAPGKTYRMDFAVQYLF